jgi:hypothetical protein
MNQNMRAKFAIELDGQEAMIIVSALLDQAKGCRDPLRPAYNRELARRITAERETFQRRHGERIMSRFEEAAHGTRP